MKTEIRKTATSTVTFHQHADEEGTFWIGDRFHKDPLVLKAEAKEWEACGYTAKVIPADHSGFEHHMIITK